MSKAAVNVARFRCILFRESIKATSSVRHYGQSTEKPDVKAPGPMKNFILNKYLSYIDRISLQVETKYPRVYRLYRLFKDGIVDFLSDAKLYYKVAPSIWNGAPLGGYTHKELEVYKCFPHDFKRTAIFIALCEIPVIDIIVPITAYMFPRQLLCRHFWTEQQRTEFASQDLRRCLPHHPQILSFLRFHSAFIYDPGLQQAFLQNVISPIMKGQQPDVQAILDVKDVFVNSPFGLDQLWQGWRQRLHMWHLARGLDMTVGKPGLVRDSKLIFYMDRALLREGLDSLTLSQLRQCCFRRGFNAQGVSEEDLRDYMQKWLQISAQLNCRL
ncbi:hypothetical protein CAPTEDRAFT_203488 [Capitella teleta]|uniref:Letm1 RBD domain-containing protein n=1 Tax=Capitella teleta TaxID=283909 RepID=R7V6E2_CAPTE|nr:hypothetical protein CAPTEDRAFT_203488 [Capitella teleta]|eukprot:ELU14134.1 hypothetical protein CAPTEDRAFT_203488 [Capitella teleta]